MERAHSAPRCSGENCASCLPKRESAGLQVLNVLFGEEVLDGSPEFLCLTFPPAVHREAGFLHFCQHLALSYFLILLT